MHEQSQQQKENRFFLFTHFVSLFAEFRFSSKYIYDNDRYLIAHLEIAPQKEKNWYKCFGSLSLCQCVRRTLSSHAERLSQSEVEKKLMYFWKLWSFVYGYFRSWDCALFCRQSLSWTSVELLHSVFYSLSFFLKLSFDFFSHLLFTF